MRGKLIFIVPIILVAFFIMLPEPNDRPMTQNGATPNSSSTKSTSVENSSVNLVNGNFIIREVRFYDGVNKLERADVRITDFKVSNVAESLPQQTKLPETERVPEIDGKGKTLIPGLIDSHTHAYMDALSEAINFGVMTELDMFTMPEFANIHQVKREQLDNTNSADLFSATILATAPGGHGTQFGSDIPVLENSSQVDAFVLQRIEQGADYIKAVYNSKKAKRKNFPSIDHDTLKALVIAAHQHGKLLVVHIDNLVSAREAIELGADGIIHSFMDTLVDDSFVKLMLEKKAFMIPTLTVQASMTQQIDNKDLLARDHNVAHLTKLQTQQLKTNFPNFGIPPEAFANAMNSVKLLVNAGVTVLAGSDAPNSGISHGISLHAELELLAKAGLSNQQILHSATGAVGQHFSIGNRGRLIEDSRATMILLDGNPFENISDTQKISRIWKNGKEFERVLKPESVANTVFSPGLINDFNQKIHKTLMGAGLGESTDQFAGGKSVVELALIKDSRTPSDQYLKVIGEVKQGFMFPWSGFSYLLGKDPQSGVDLSNISAIRFKAKGGSKTTQLSVLIFQSGSMHPLQEDLILTQDWQDFKVELAQFKNLDLTDVANISIVRTQKTGQFEFMIDNLIFE